jgi:hypothetical protein
VALQYVTVVSYVNSGVVTVMLQYLTVACVCVRLCVCACVTVHDVVNLVGLEREHFGETPPDLINADHRLE